MSDIDPEDLRPGDVVRLRDSDSEWRVVEPVEERETATHSGKLVGVTIKGSVSLGDWKPVRRVVDHIPRGAEFEDSESDEQATLDDAVAAAGGDAG